MNEQMITITGFLLFLIQFGGMVTLIGHGSDVLADIITVTNRRFSAFVMLTALYLVWTISYLI